VAAPNIWVAKMRATARAIFELVNMVFLRCVVIKVLLDRVYANEDDGRRANFLFNRGRACARQRSGIEAAAVILLRPTEVWDRGGGRHTKVLVRATAAGKIDGIVRRSTPNPPPATFPDSSILASRPSNGPRKRVTSL
jgi:hypothetical protein